MKLWLSSLRRILKLMNFSNLFQTDKVVKSSQVPAKNRRVLGLLSIGRLNSAWQVSLQMAFLK